MENLSMNRRQFMSTSFAAVSAAALCPSQNAFGAAAPEGGAKPNIVVIMADDLGFSDIGCYGSEIQTPNLDRLAGEGIRFTQAYNVARCCPSRAALLTGLYPHQAGMGDMTGGGAKERPEGPYQGYLNHNCVTMAELLHGAGYSTYMSGKWHVGEKAEHWPRKRGFDRYFGLISGASSYFEILQQESPRRVMVRDDDPYTPEGDHFYMTDAFTDNAVQFLTEHDASKPFLLYLAYTAPHWPLHALEEDIAKYRGKYGMGWDKLREERYARMVKEGIIDPKWTLSPRDSEVPAWDGVEDKEDWDLRMAVYAAMIDRMDQGVGRVLDTLKQQGMEDNTLVLFLADNGGCHEDCNKPKLHKPGAQPGTRESYTAYKRPWANASNTPFRMFKHWCHEGGIATPLIARWPSRIKEHGALTNQVAHITDIMATCADISGAHYPESSAGEKIAPLVGKSLAPVFDGKTREPRSPLFWEHEGNRAMRENQWKLVATAAGDWELYDLEADRTELTNLAQAQPDRAKAMLGAWNGWADEIGVKKVTESGGKQKTE
jgi:arylsulfatase